MSYQSTFENCKTASRALPLLKEDKVNELLRRVADHLEDNVEGLLEANIKDLERMDPADPKYDRLKLTEKRIKDIAADMRSVARLPSPLGRVLQQNRHANGMFMERVSVPFGVIGIIYEARPNVTFDVFALCFKSGNACLLKGGSDAQYSNTFGVELIRSVLTEHKINPDCICLLPPDRAATAALLKAHGYVDLVIPRGSSNLIDHVRSHAEIPVIETGAGICHTYFDEFGDVRKGLEIIHNAKTRRVSVCNALDCLIVHEARIEDLPQLCEKLADHQVKIHADEAALQVLSGHYPENLLMKASASAYGTEFLSYQMSIKTVANIDEALNHIRHFSSMHSECIVSEDRDRLDHFLTAVDAAAVYANVSTAFTDGAQFGLGAEIGISTQKMHARGPMGLEELCSYKWLIKGRGQIRE